MWFRQLALFRLPPDARPDLAKLEAGMEQHCFAPPSGLEWSSQGFVAPAGHAPDRLLHPDVELVVGAAVHIDPSRKVLDVRSDDGPIALDYDRLVYAVGSGGSTGRVPGAARFS